MTGRLAVLEPGVRRARRSDRWQSTSPDHATTLPLQPTPDWSEPARGTCSKYALFLLKHVGDQLCSEHGVSHLCITLAEPDLAMDNVWVGGAMGAIKAVALVCDIVTYPIYLLLQRPWEKKRMSDRVKGHVVARDANSVTFRTTAVPKEMHLTLVREDVTTMERLARYLARRYKTRRCLGTRQILAEEDEKQKDGRLFKKYVLGDYHWKSYTDVDNMSNGFGNGLRALGQEPRNNVVIFAETREEWMIAAQGCWKQNIPVVTIYSTLGDEAIAHGINETEVTMLITSHDLLPKFKKILPMCPRVQTIIYMRDQLKTTDTTGYKEGVKIVSFNEVIQMGSSSAGKVTAVPSTPDDTAIIMYTSGSTGVPKGVILTHRNMISTLRAFSDVTDIGLDDTFLGFLPLAHVFEMLVESTCMLAGVPIGYSTPLTMIDSSSKIKYGTKGDASVLKPTVMTSVPLILDRIYKGVHDKVSKKGPFAKALFEFACQYKSKWSKRGFDTPFLNRVVFRPVRAVLGGRMRAVLCGGAPLSPETHENIKNCLGINVIQGYGLTETTSLATVMDLHDRTLARVGNPTTMTDIRLVDWEEGNYRVSDKPCPRGEVVVGGDSISPGYYKMPEKTKEDFFEEDGKRWFKTGDIGECHADGVLKIIDRKKDLVKLQLGEYVSLGKVETQLKTCPLVENICVYGDPTKHYTVALVVPNQSHLAQLGSSVGLSGASFEDLCHSPAMEKAVLRELADHAKRCKLEKFEVPAAVKLCTEVWLPDGGLVTAAFKLKRKDIQERYQHEINRMYAS